MARLKDALLQRGLADSGKKAEGLILAGQVLVNDAPVTKPGTNVAATDVIRIRGVKQFVSRAAMKLDHALETFAIHVEGRAFLDIGASTGGFSDALLQRGAAYVAAIDVGKGLLHQKIRSDARVEVFEGQDFREFEASRLRHAVNAFVADVSFASLEGMIHKAFSLLTPDRWPAEGIVLFKPQFELPKAERSLLHKGILQDENKSALLLREFEARLAAQHIRVAASQKAIVKGTKGNQEFVLHLTRQ